VFGIGDQIWYCQIWNLNSVPREAPAPGAISNPIRAHVVHAFPIASANLPKTLKFDTVDSNLSSSSSRVALSLFSEEGVPVYSSSHSVFLLLPFDRSMPAISSSAVHFKISNQIVSRSRSSWCNLKRSHCVFRWVAGSCSHQGARSRSVDQLWLL